jgi:aspartate-semialdehyde dehydrogenase
VTGAIVIDSSSSWRRKVTAVLVMAAVTPPAVAIIARTAVELLGPVVPYAIVALVLLGIYRLVIRDWWWH